MKRIPVVKLRNEWNDFFTRSSAVAVISDRMRTAYDVQYS